jgi:hypothetical protein
LGWGGSQFLHINGRMASQFHQCCIHIFHSSAISGMYHHWIQHVSFAGLLLGHDHFLLNSFEFITYRLLHRQLCVVRDNDSVIKQSKNYGVNYYEISERDIRPVALPLTLLNMMLIMPTSGIDDGHLMALNKSCLNYILLHIKPKG